MKSKTSPTDLIVQQSCKIIGEHGKPMPLSKLYEELSRRGVAIGGSDPRANLSTKLSSAKAQLCNIKHLGWWLTAKKAEFSQKQESPANGVARLS